MTEKTLIINADFIAKFNNKGVDAIKEFLGDVSYPISLIFKNNTNPKYALTESKVFVDSNFSAQKSSVEVVYKDFDALVREISNVSISATRNPKLKDPYSFTLKEKEKEIVKQKTASVSETEQAALIDGAANTETEQDATPKKGKK
jgi:hypothetical protein